MAKIFVPRFARAYEDMFKARGFEVVDFVEKADLVQFVGGFDVSPKLYGEDVHPLTSYSDDVDKVDIEIFHEALDLGIPMAGICRGGQFLHVMSGGSMWQHVDGHGVFQGHYAECSLTKRHYLVSSTHHQMMSGEVGEVILKGVNTNNTFKETLPKDAEKILKIYKEDGYDEVEAVWHPDTKCLSYQPHPEICRKDSECQELYFHYLKYYFGIEA